MCHGRGIGNNNYSFICKGRGTDVVADLSEVFEENVNIEATCLANIKLFWLDYF